MDRGLNTPGEAGEKEIERNGNPFSIQLNIEELVLYGFPPADRYLIGEAAQRELERLFREKPLPTSLQEGGQIPYLRTGVFEFEDSTPAWQIGIQIAGTLFKGFTG